MIKGSSPLLGDALSSLFDPLSQASLSIQTSFKVRSYSYARVSNTYSVSAKYLSKVWFCKSESSLNQFNLTLLANSANNRNLIRHTIVARGQAYIKGFSFKYSSMSYFRNLGSGFGVSHT